MKQPSLFFLAALGLFSAASSSAHAQAFVGLRTGGTSISVYSAPGAAASGYTITGLNSGDSLVNIDNFTSSTASFSDLEAVARSTRSRSAGRALMPPPSTSPQPEFLGPRPSTSIRRSIGYGSTKE